MLVAKKKIILLSALFLPCHTPGVMGSMSVLVGLVPV